ncbi:MAG TPA: TIGR03435 family protein [Bryobacteraceae bacterium]|nr:TIGR03435 family protein [Bryobacteraceae bacterium]
MRIRILAFAVFAVLAGAALGQTADPTPGFEIADIHISASARYPAMRSALRAGRYELKNATMADLIATAWGIEPARVLGGPNWLEADRFDVIAKVPANAAPAAVRLMLRSLLAERFHLAVHADQMPAAAFVLSKGSGKPNMKQSESAFPDRGGPPGCERQAADSNTIPAICHALTMQMFVQQLRAAAGDYLMAPVIDQTNLEGNWDFTLRWTPRGRLAAAGSDAITIFDAIDKQLGLKLESKQMPTPVIVVESVNRTPAENPPDAAVLDTPPPQFEAATIKPADPQSQIPRVAVTPNGYLNLQGVTLSYLIQTIWFITPEMIVNAPKWLDNDRWDITAKVAAAAGGPPQTDTDSLIAMIRALLEDRFKLHTHTEQRTVPAYTLTAVKPKLSKTDPASRTVCREGPGADGKDPRMANPALSRLVTCRNVTMQQFTARLPGIANALNPLNGPIRSAVSDSTGLTDAYDLTFSFSPELGRGPNAAPAPPSDGPSDPSGAVSIADAISRQLGLRLAIEKRPAPVLVIDAIEQKPTAN